MGRTHSFKWMANSCEAGDDTGVATFVVCGQEKEIPFLSFGHAAYVSQMLDANYENGIRSATAGMRHKINKALEDL